MHGGAVLTVLVVMAELCLGHAACGTAANACYAVQDRGSGLDAVHVLHNCCCVAVSVLLCLVALGLSQMRFTAA